MLLRNEDVILKERVPLYNNIAQIDGCKGCLSAQLEVYPTPRIFWEFEVLGRKRTVARLPTTQGDMKGHRIIGHNLVIESPQLTGTTYTADGSRTVLRGYATNILIGDIDTPASTFIFYLPNVKFQETNLTGQQRVEKRLEEGEWRRLIASGEGERSLETQIDDEWVTRLFVQQEALDWMEQKKKNIGTLVTTVAALSPAKPKSRKAKSLTITTRDAMSKLETLSRLFCYANGGYLGPVYIEALRKRSHRYSMAAAVASSWQTTPLEQLGTSWVGLDSDLRAYLQCFTTLDRMLKSPAWNPTFDLILAWYFQMTSGPKAWPIAANAVGTALERLSYTLLILEEQNVRKRKQLELLFNIADTGKAKKVWVTGKKYGNNLTITGKRLELLLERVGLTKTRGFTDIDDVMGFLQVRNDATHPRSSGIPVTEIDRLLRQAVQWLVYD